MIANGEPRVAQLSGVGIEPSIRFYKRSGVKEVPKKKKKKRDTQERKSKTTWVV